MRSSALWFCRDLNGGASVSTLTSSRNHEIKEFSRFSDWKSGILADSETGPSGGGSQVSDLQDCLIWKSNLSQLLVESCLNIRCYAHGALFVVVH